MIANLANHNTYYFDDIMNSRLSQRELCTIILTPFWL